MNTPGYDPRAKQILGDWMVSIPAIRKHPELVEYAYQTGGSSADNIGSSTVDTLDAALRRGLAGPAGLRGAVSAAQQRLAIFHTGVNAAVPLEQGQHSLLEIRGSRSKPRTSWIPSVEATPSAIPFRWRTHRHYDNPLPEHPHWVSTDLIRLPVPGRLDRRTGRPYSSDGKCPRAAADGRSPGQAPRTTTSSRPSPCCRARPSTRCRAS